jgi:2-(1,2-epoxy-1,2-dihydrophenyl)acetyl-CoA isomerase
LHGIAAVAFGKIRITFAMSEVLFEVREGCGRITLNRPEARNAMTPAMVQGVGDALRRSELDDAVRCVLLTGAGAHFSVGGDVKNFSATLEQPAPERKRLYEQRVLAAMDVLSLLARFPKPMVVAARGAVAGMAISFALAADFVLGSEDCNFAFAHTKIGLPPDSGLSYFLPRVVGRSKALQLILLGTRVNSAEALDLGLIERRVPDAELDGAIEALVRLLASGATTALVEAKKLLNRPTTGDLAEQLRAESRAVGECAASADFEEGVRAFLARRPAVFLGK